jgi:hypothetical protein
MSRKRPKPRRDERFDGPDRRDASDEAGLLGGPTSDSGLFDAPDKSPGQMPGLFELRRRPASGGADLPDKPARAAPAGLFAKPPRRKSDSPR